MSKKALIIQGGGFRTGFTAGVLDVFLENNLIHFDVYGATSGGAIALSYYLARQAKSCFVAMCYMAQHPEFMSYYRMASSTGIMDVDRLRDVAEDVIPFDLNVALENTKNAKLGIVLTNLENGMAEHHAPRKEDWIDAVIASCTLPFVTKGRHEVNGCAYMDGGWGDPLPVEWAVNNGATDILVIRTLPADLKLTQSWTDYFGSIYHRTNEALSKVFAESHLVYNKSIDFMNRPPEGVRVQQIAPETALNASTYSNSVDAITKDYFLGREMGLKFLATQK